MKRKSNILSALTESMVKERLCTWDANSRLKTALLL